MWFMDNMPFNQKISNITCRIENYPHSPLPAPSPSSHKKEAQPLPSLRTSALVFGGWWITTFCLESDFPSPKL